MNIMGLLSFIPDSVLEYFVNILLIVGAVSTVLSFFVINRILRFFPALSAYYFPIQIVSLVLLVAGIFFKGGYSVEAVWRERVAEAEAEMNRLQKVIDASEAKSGQLNRELEEERKKKQRVIREVQVVVQERIRTIEKKIDAECKVAPEALEVHNDAARNKVGQ